MRESELKTGEASSSRFNLSTFSRFLDYSVVSFAWFCLIAVVIYFGLYLLAMSSTSLWTDEFYSIANFSQKGMYAAWTDYHAPNNHILFNMMASVVPASAAYHPFWARLLSFLAVGLALAGLLKLSSNRRLFAGTTLAIALIFLNEDSLDLTLQARGYGFAFAAAIIQYIALYRFILKPEAFSRNVLLIAAFVGGAVLPIYVPLAAISVLCAFIVHPSWSFVRAGAIVAVAGAIFYSPTAFQIIDYAQIYAEAWGKHYSSLESVGETLEYIVPSDPLLLTLIIVNLVISGAALLARGWSPELKVVIICLLSFFGFVTVCLIMETPLVRTTQFTVAPIAIAGIVIVTTKANGRQFAAVQSIALSLALAIVGLNGINQIRNWQFSPLEAWLSSAKLAEDLTSDEIAIHVPFRPHQIIPYLDDPRRLRNDLDEQAFARGEILVIDATIRTLDRFDGTTISKNALNIDVPQRRRGRSRISLVPKRTGALRSINLLNVEGRQPDMATEQAFDGDPETRWSNRRPQRELSDQTRITFELNEEGSCTKFFWYSWNKGLPEKYTAIAIQKERRNLDLSARTSTVTPDLIMIDLSGLNVQAIQFDLKPDPKSKSYLAINEVWCGY